MKRRILLFVLPLILVAGCSNLGYINFTGNGNIAEPSCWIRVIGANYYGDYYTDTEPDGINSTYTIGVFDVQRPNVDISEGAGMVSIADAQVVAYLRANDGYWFKVDITGYRTANIEGDTQYAGEISTGQFWVKERNVVEADESIFTNGCMSLIRAGEFESLGIARRVYCEFEILHRETPLRVGPGENRAIRLYAQSIAKYSAIAKTIVEEQQWYQLDLGSGNLLWVDANDVDLYTETDGQIHCGSLPKVDPPPIIQGASNQTLTIEQSGDCTSFNILRPIGTVAEGESTYRWSPVDEADQYILNFSDYQGNYVISILVDGSQNSVVINTGSLATGSQLSFEIVAMSNNEPLCRSNSGPLTRTAGFVAPETPAPQPTREPTKEKKGGGGYTPPET